MSTDLTPPAVPDDALENGGWEQTELTEETLFEMPAVKILGVTRRFEDTRTRTALREQTAGHVDHPVRFFAVTRLVFQPSLPPGVTPKMFAPTLRSEARRTFARRIEKRGLDDIERERSERIRLPDGSRARMTRFSATDTLENGAAIPLECWVTIWTGSKTVRIVTGGYPATTLDSVFDVRGERLAVEPDEYRSEFISLLRGVAAAE